MAQTQHQMERVVIVPAVASSVVSAQSQPKRKKSWKEKKSEKAESIFDDSTHQWLFSKDAGCTERMLGYLVILIQLISYIILGYMAATDHAANHDVADVHLCFSRAGSTFVALFVFGYLLRDVIGIFSVGCLNICASLFVFIELLAAIIAVVFVDIFEEGEFAAVSAGIGVLFVHDLDEQLYGALGKVNSKCRKCVVFGLWIGLAILVGIMAHDGGCGTDTTEITMDS